VDTVHVLGTRERPKLRAGRDDQRVIVDLAISHVHDLAGNVQAGRRLAEKKLYVKLREYIVAPKETESALRHRVP
jgi:hypothetical protein